MSRDQAFLEIAQRLGYLLESELKTGGHYVPVLREGAYAYVSGQTPRIAHEMVVQGQVGRDVSLNEACFAAQICILRALDFMQKELGSLDAVARFLKLTVYVQSASDFLQQSVVADAASQLLTDIFADQGQHTRSAIGVIQLPANATVEIDLIAKMIEE